MVDIRPDAELEDVETVVANVGIKWRDVGGMGSLQSVGGTNLTHGVCMNCGEQQPIP